MTMRSYKTDVVLNREAEKLLDSLTGSILQEAQQAAVSRRDTTNARRDKMNNDKMNNVVSPIDIVEGLASRRYRSWQRDRAVFASQVFGTAVAVSAVVMSFAVTVLSLGDGSSSSAEPVDPRATTSLFVTVLLALLAVVSATLIMVVIRDVLAGKLGAMSAYSSRNRDKTALVQEWAVFEDAMRRDLGIQDDRKSGSHLSAIISEFAQIYGVDVEDIKNVLRTRNSVVYHSSKVPISEVRASLEKLRALIKILEIADHGALRRSSF